MRIVQKLKDIGKRLYADEKYYLLKRVHSEVIPQNKEPFKGYFEKVAIENVYDTIEFESESYTKAYLDMLKQGDYGVFGYLDNQCVYRKWYQMSGVIRLCGQNILSLKENEAYSKYDYCKPEARGNAFQYNSILFFVNEFPKYDLYTLVKVDNMISLHNVEKAGFCIISDIQLISRFGFRKLYISSHSS